MAAPVTEIVAWWGAIVATGVLIWDVIKWRLAGPKLRRTVKTGMQPFNILVYEGKTVIIAHVTNYGDRPTTITHLAFLFYRNWWRRLVRKANENYIIMTPNTIHPVPYELKPGTTWDGIAVQEKKTDKMAREGHLICALYHSHKERPLRRRITIQDKPRQE